MKRDRIQSELAFEKACRLVPGGVNSPVRAFKQVGGTPVFFKHASGSRFVDIDGNEFVDFCQSWGPLILGHGHPEVVEAVRAAAPDGLSFGACHEREIEMAMLVLSALPEFENIRLVNSGTEAVMTALRIARAFTKRDLVVKFEGGYHGHCDAMLVMAGSGLATQGIASSAGVPADTAKTTLVAQFDNEESVAALFTAHGNEIAAVIIEPLPANNGLLIQRPEFLSFLRDITKKHNALLIFDEVISGFRLHFGGYYQLVGVTPDMVTLGKIIGGGMPVGAIASSREIMSMLAPLGSAYQAGTLSGNPVALAAGFATLSLLKSDPPYEKLERLGKVFEETLAAGGVPYARACRAGSILWPYYDTGDYPRTPAGISAVTQERFSRIYWLLIDMGYYLPPSSLEVMFLSSAHTEDEAAGCARAIVECLASSEK
jgi:glutamate-1-semialdehyde 2,1-aminomutase